MIRLSWITEVGPMQLQDFLRVIEGDVLRKEKQKTRVAQYEKNFDLPLLVLKIEE